MAKRECNDSNLGECKGPVTYDVDPYRADLYDDLTKVWMCAKHRKESGEAL